jgi:hypothetical protein
MTGNKTQFRIKGRHPLYHILNLIAICGNLPEFRLKDKVNLNDIVIVGLGEMAYRLRFSNLPSPFDKKWLTIMVGSPGQQVIVEFSPQISDFVSHNVRILPNFPMLRKSQPEKMSESTDALPEKMSESADL